MRDLLRKSLLAFTVVSLMVLVPQSGLFADTDPSSAVQTEEPSDTAADAAVEDAAAPQKSNTLGQFPQAEIAPAVAQSRQQFVSSGNEMGTANRIDGISFPKVRTAQDEDMAKKFAWWPTDAKPAPYKDPERSGYWWWPDQPGQARPWGNQGYIYVRKIIFDYKESEGEMKPSLVIKRILKNVKVYFDYDKSELRDDAIDALEKALYTLEHNLKADILITGNADTRGSEQYNQKLGERRANSVRDYLLEHGLPEDRIKILSRGKLDALAPTNDLVGMQKDRNAQFMIAEVEEVMIPASKAAFFQDQKIVEEKKEIEGAIKVSTKDYVIQKGDTLWAIAKQEYGDGRQWKRLYEFNKDVIADPNKPKKGTKIQIPIE